MTLLLICVVFLLFGTRAQTYRLQVKPKERYIQISVSLVILAVALFVFFRHWCYPQDSNWAFGALGTILGFWLSKK
jgi:hypothetical protein